MRKPIENSLRLFRLRKGLSQTDVTRALGLRNRNRIEEWESGRAFPRVINLFKLSQLLGVTQTALYSRRYRFVGKPLAGATSLRKSQ